MFRKQQHGGRYVIFNSEVRIWLWRSVDHRQLSCPVIVPATVVFSHTLGKPKHKYSRELSKGWEALPGNNVVNMVFVKINISVVTRIHSTKGKMEAGKPMA